MRSSGINFKRGLATTAISALAVVGLPALAGTASATPLSDQAGGADQVVMLSLFGASNKVSTKNDGTNATVSLAAGGGSGITAVDFSYSLDGVAFEPIASDVTRSANGAFEFEWAPPALLNGATVTMRVQGFLAPADATAADTVTKAGVQILNPISAQNTVEITNAALRVFQQPYGGTNGKNLAVVSGTTSAADGTVAVSARSGGATGTVSAPVTAGAFTGVLDISGYSFGDFAVAGQNQIVVGAERDTDDAAALNIVRQTITTVVATAAGDAPEGGTTTVTVVVEDQNAAPVVGAQVYDTNGNRLIGYTDINGEVKDTAAAGGSHTYYANSTANPAFQAGIDKSDDEVVDSYVAVPTTSAPKSTDGNEFDDDEYAAGDITVTVKDQNANPVANRAVEYYWAVPGGTNVPATGWSSASTGADGMATIVFPTSAASGVNTLHYRVPADANGLGAIAEKSDLAVTAGQASLVLTPAEADAAAGAQQVFNGTLRLDDPNTTALPGRDVKFDYTRGTEKAPADGTADAGIIAANGTDIVLTRTVASSNAGDVTVTVKDATVADPTKQGSELGGKLDAATSVTKDIGNAGAADSSTMDFTSSNSLADVELAQTSGELSMPGRATRYSVTVTNDDGSPRANVDVTVSIDKGTLFATDTNGNALEDGTTPINGDFLPAVSQTTVKTNAEGVAYIAWGVTRDAGFDDDGSIVGNLSISYQGESGSDEESFFSGNQSGNQLDPQTGRLVGWSSPLNIGSIDMSLAAAGFQESTVLPKASTSQQVALDLVITDQFGNRTKVRPGWWEDGTVYDNTNDAYVSGNDGYSQFVGEDPSWNAYAEKTTNQRIFSELRGVADETPVDIAWYEVDYALSSLSLDHDTADRVRVNTAVTETVEAKDQFGQPIPGLTVEYLRSGPNAQDGDVNYDDNTGSNGKSTYNFVGTAAGTANITAVVRDGNEQITKLTDSVVFAAPAPTAINARLTGSDNGAKADVVRVKAAKANGAVVRLYKVVNGVRKLVRTGTLNASGAKLFVAKDTNGRKATKYVAVVSKTADTKADTSNAKWIR